MAQATQEQLDAVDAAIQLSNVAVKKMRILSRIVREFRERIDLEDVWDPTPPDYDAIKAIMAPMYTAARSSMDTAYTEFKTATNSL